MTLKLKKKLVKKSFYYNCVHRKLFACRKILFTVRNTSLCGQAEGWQKMRATVTVALMDLLIPHPAQASRLDRCTVMTDM